MPAIPYLPLKEAIADKVGIVTSYWRDFFLNTTGSIQTLQSTVASVLGVNRFALASQPSLGSSDTGYIGFVTDYAHLVYFDGSNWQWLDGDQPGRFQHFAVAPGAGWVLCDGTATTYLVVGGASLSSAAFTTPNASGSACYLKSGAYSGTIVAAGGVTGTGSTGTGSTGTGTTGDADGVSLSIAGDGAATPLAYTPGGANVSLNLPAHVHSGTVDIPGLSIPSLSIPALAVPALGVGSLDMAHLSGPIYFRR